jgi:hypothetical protein
VETIEAATLGGLFFLAMFVPPFFGGLDPTTMGQDSPWAIVLGIVSAAGVGALLQLAGRGMWELFTPYGPQSGWRFFRERKNDRTCDTLWPCRAGVTQSVECLLPKQNVAGSSPVSRSTFPLTLTGRMSIRA